MKFRLLILALVLSCVASAQTTPQGYTYINSGYEWLRGKFRALNIPAGCDTATAITTGQYRFGGALYADTCRHILYLHTGGAWRNVFNGAVDSIYRKSGQDSIFWRRGGTEFAIKDSAGGGGGVSTAVYSEGITTRNDTAIIANNRDIYYITQPTTGSALASGWSEISTPSYTVSNGQFVFTGGANNFTEYIRNDLGVLSEGCYLEAYVICNTIGASDQGPRIGWKSYNTNGFVHDVHAGYVTGGSATNPNKAVLFGSTGASTSVSDSARVAFDGDTLYYRLTRVGISYRIYVKNITKGWKLQKYVETTPLGSPFVAHNSAYISVIPGAGDYTVYGLRYVIQAPLQTDNYIVGNSISYRQAATTEAQGYTSLIGTPANNIGSGGGADITASVLARVKEIIAIKPRRVIMMIGGNDILFGVSSATWQANYIAIRDSLVNRGIAVAHCLPTPRTATDVSALKFFIDTSSTFRSDVVIDTWTSLLGSGTSLATKYTGDATHPNSAGHAEVAAKINDALHYPNGTTSTVARNLFVPNGYVAAADAGTGADQFLAGAFIARQSASTTNYLQMGHVSGYGYLQGVNQGTGYTHLVLSPGSGARVGIRETAPTAVLDIRDAGSGTTRAVNINHAGSYSAEGQELSIDFQNAHSTVTRISNFLGPSTSFGWKFYSYSGGAVNSTPALTLYGISNFAGINTATPVSRLHVVGSIRGTDSLLITGVSSFTGGTSVGGTPSSAYASLLGGTGWTSGVLGIVGAETSPASGSTGSLIISSGTIVEASSGTHPYLANVFLPAPTITPGTATVTDAATLIVSAPTTATVTGTNSAILAASGDIRAGNGNVTLGTAGNKINVATGSNASIGVSGTLTAGTITISTTAVTSSSKIFLTVAAPAGVQGILSVGTIVNGTSFVINSTSATETSTVNWWIIN